MMHDIGWILESYGAVQLSQHIQCGVQTAAAGSLVFSLANKDSGGPRWMVNGDQTLSLMSHPDLVLGWDLFTNAPCYQASDLNQERPVLVEKARTDAIKFYFQELSSPPPSPQPRQSLQLPLPSPVWPTPPMLWSFRAESSGR